MGAGPWSLLTVLFRVIPRFPPTRSVRECATPTSPGVCGHRESRRRRDSRHRAPPPAYAGSGRASPQRCGPTHTTPTSRTTTPGTTTTQSSRCTDTTISTQNRTDLEPEVNRSQCGNGPISARVSTDLDGGGARRGCAGLHRVASCTLLARSPQGLGGMRADGRTVEAWLL